MAETPEVEKSTEIQRLDLRVKALENAAKVLVPGDLNVAQVTYTASGTANTTDPVTHGLKRPPTGFFVIGQDAAGSVYDDRGTPWTADKMYLKSSVANVKYRLLVF